MLSTIRPLSFFYTRYKHLPTITDLIASLFIWTLLTNVVIIRARPQQATPDPNEVTVAPYFNDAVYEQKQPVACYRCIPRLHNDCSVLNSKGIPLLNRKVICDSPEDVCLSAIGVHQHPVGTDAEEAVKRNVAHGDAFRIFTCASQGDLRYLGLVNNGTQNNCQHGHYENQQLLQLFVPQDAARARYMDYAIKSCICDTDFCNTEQNHNDKFVPIITAKADYVNPEDFSTTTEHSHPTNVLEMMVAKETDAGLDPAIRQKEVPMPYVAAAVPAVVAVAAPTTNTPRTTTTTRKPAESSSSWGWFTILLIIFAVLALACLLFGLFKFLRNRKKRQANISGNHTRTGRSANGITVEHDQTLLTQTTFDTKSRAKKGDSV